MDVLRKLEHKNIKLEKENLEMARAIDFLETQAELLEQTIAIKDRQLKEKDEKGMKEFNELLDDLKEKDAFIERSRRKRNELEKEIKELRKDLETTENEKEEVEDINDKQKKMLKDIILKNHKYEKDACEMKDHEEALVNEKVDLGKKYEEQKIDIALLAKQVEDLEKLNVEKEMLINDVNREHEKLLAKLDDINKENDELKAKLDQIMINDENKKNEFTSSSLEEELGCLNLGKEFIQNFPCRTCDKSFSSRKSLRKHILEVHVAEEKMKLLEIENRVANQTARFISDLERLITKEHYENRMPCVCKYFCNISHLKHNWKKQASKSILDKFVCWKNLKTNKTELSGGSIGT